MVAFPRSAILDDHAMPTIGRETATSIDRRVAKSSRLDVVSDHVAPTHVVNRSQPVRPDTRPADLAERFAMMRVGPRRATEPFARVDASKAQRDGAVSYTHAVFVILNALC
jgi:hypothetical protein